MVQFIFGRRLRSSEDKHQRIKPLQGVPVLGLDALGSASYGPEATLTLLIPLGTVGLLYIREVIGAILLLLGLLFISYWQTIGAYPTGGGSYTVARDNLGSRAGVIAASSLMLDYVLNVAVGKPLLDYIQALQSKFPKQVIAVVVPELVEPRWWEKLLHNHVATAFKAMLMIKCARQRLIVITTPWFLRE